MQHRIVKHKQVNTREARSEISRVNTIRHDTARRSINQSLHVLHHWIQQLLHRNFKA